MTKRLSALCFGVILFFAMLAVTFTASAAISDTSGRTYHDFHSGIVEKNTYNTAAITQERSWELSYFAQQYAKITPDPSLNPTKPVALDHYSISQYNINAATLKYISIYCKYEGSKDLGKAVIKLQPHSGKYYTETIAVYSNEDVKSGEWQWINFDIGSAAYAKVTGNPLFQFHLLPYGNTASGELTSSDVMKIGKIRFLDYTKASSVTGIYPISFTGARPDVEGTDPETVYVNVGSSITLPENPYTRENHEFAGWICSADNQLYQPGDAYTVTERTRSTGSLLYNATGEAVFFPEWEYVGGSADLPDILSVEYTDYIGSLTFGDKTTYSITKNYGFMGRNTAKLTISTASTDAIVADGWTWNTVPFDLEKYKYATITYFVDTEKNFSATPRLQAQPNGNVLTGATDVFSEYPLETGKWAVMGFDLSKLEAKFNPDLDSHILRQFHLCITGHKNADANKIKASDFNEGDAIYFDTLTLYTEKPEGELRVQTGLINGDGNGHLRPHDPLTRAEAAQLIANVLINEGKVTEIPENIEMTFSDVSQTDWFYYAVMGLDSLGYVPEDGLFRPYDNITVAEFLRFMQLMEFGGNHEPSFTGHPGNTSYLTRAEAAVLLSDRLTNGIPEQFYAVDIKMFDDLDTFGLEYLPIMNVCASRLSAFDENGKETIYQLLCPGSTYNSLEYNTGDTARYIKQLDKLENDRITEIRNAESVYKTRAGGNIYYVSSTEGTTDGGASADAPKLITTLSELTGMGTNGDVILFKRGDIFRGNFTATAGVTYSAYGEGEKPRLYRSEKNHTGAENWSVHYSDETGKTIWKTNNEVSTDAGAITINDGEIIGLKEIPSYLDGVYYVRGQENTTVFDLVTELDNNHEFFHDIGGDINKGGIVYFRCDEGNPGELYESIEMNQRVNCLRASSNVTIDNLCIKYFGSHGIGAGTVSNLTVTNCEIGRGGGSIQHFNADGTVTRFGNGVEIYGGLVNFTIDNCYVYEIYDAGITHQISRTSAGNYYMKNVVYSNNVLCDSTYNIEYFMSIDNASATTERFMENVLFENNLIRRAGYGWGQQRPDDAPAGIKGWTHHNNAVNTIVRNNIIDRCYNHVGGTSHLIQMGTTYNAAGPYLENNTFVQVPGRYFAYTHQSQYMYNHGTEHTILNNIGGTGNKLYYAAEDNGIR